MISKISTAQYTNTDIVAKIKTKTNTTIASIVGNATNTTEVYKSLRYTISVFKTDTANNVSKNTQEGRFTLEANESKELSKVSIDIDTSSKIVVLLLIYEEDKIVGKDRIVFNDQTTNTPQTTKQSASNDGIELKGIVVEETKTKPGKDFYELFYASYVLHHIDGNKIVAVVEKLNFGRSTIIQIKIEDTIIHEFIGKPDIEYLEQMSKIGIRKVYTYFKNLEKQKNDIFQY
ncbi:CsgE family curli-type amyloid fiber assembly protein [Aquimarina longa]|uniref:CsgE family curli-type amyloid fiber assembly protein n=1 Tax=Aquimarina longa TaxID=1080221 RepID=UPI00130EA294|nr:CsgE family curli-type amyloid fiber assembly protein [Aquimarina longa]